MELIDTLPSNTAIHCETMELDNAVRQILHKEGFCWSNENSIGSISRFYEYRSRTCIIPFQGKVKDLIDCQNVNFNIVDSETFISNYNLTHPKPTPIKIALSHAKYELSKLYNVTPDLIIIEP